MRNYNTAYSCQWRFVLYFVHDRIWLTRATGSQADDAQRFWVVPYAILRYCTDIA